MDEEIKRLNEAVDKFASAMKRKLIKKYREGYKGWDNNKVISDSELANQLAQHYELYVANVDKDEIDIANLLMMLWTRKDQRGETIDGISG